MRDRIGGFGRFLEQIGAFVITGIGMLLGVALTYYSAFYTEISPLAEDGNRTVTDSVWRNGLVFLAVVVLFAVLYQGCKRIPAALPRVEKILLAIVLLCSLLGGGAWVLLSHVKPTADAGSVCLVAASMLRGEYPMQPPTYMSYNPQQYGMVFLLQCMFACFGSGNYLVWQLMNVCLFPLLIFAGYRILKLLTKQEIVCIFYLLMTILFLPFYLYLPYVYGDFPSAACGMIVMWLTIAFCRKRNLRTVIGAGLAAVLGCLVRMNTVIVVIAACLVLLVAGIRALCEDRGKAGRRQAFGMLGMILAMCLMIWGAEKAVFFYYESVSGQTIFPGIPANCYIMMGLEESDVGPGWFNGDNYVALIRTDYDPIASKAYGAEQIRLRLQQFWQDKPYAIDFFRRKILSQWNMPDCYAIHETMHFTVEKEQLPRLVYDLYYGDGHVRIMQYMNGYQFVLYACFAMAMIGLFFGKKREIAYYLPAAAVLGGFFFSILWEAMSRYVLAYEGYMILPAAIGMWEFQKLVETGITEAKKRWRKFRN